MEFKLTQEDARVYWLEITQIELADEDTGPDHLALYLNDMEAIQLFEAVEETMGDFVREMRAQKRLFDAARAQLRDELDEGEGLDPSDPKSPGFYERAVEAWDGREK